MGGLITRRATSFFDERENAALARPLVKVIHYFLSRLGMSLDEEKEKMGIY